MCAKLQLSQFVCEIHFQIYDLKMGPSEGGGRASTKLLFYKYETIHFCSKDEFVFLWQYWAVCALFFRSIYLQLNLYFYGNMGLFVLSHLCAFPFRAPPPLHSLSGLWPSLLLHGSAQQCIVLHNMVLYSLFGLWLLFQGIVWYCMVLHGIAWHCMALCGIVTPCPAYGLPCPLNKPQNPTQMHPLYSLHLHISLFKVQITTRRANPLHLL